MKYLMLHSLEEALVWNNIVHWGVPKIMQEFDELEERHFTG